MSAALAPHGHHAAQSLVRCVAFLTCHDKTRLVVEALAPLGFAIEAVSSYDTDHFGTFSREVPRSAGMSRLPP